MKWVKDKERSDEPIDKDERSDREKDHLSISPNKPTVCILFTFYKYTLQRYYEWNDGQKNIMLYGKDSEKTKGMQKT